MERQPVKSSNIKSVGYDITTMVLEVEFQNGNVYQYTGVTIEKYQALQEAPSVGSFIAAEIRPRYACTKVAPTG